MSRKSSTKSKSEKEVGNVSENECALCKTDKGEYNDWLQCEVCDKWFHAICAGVKKQILTHVDIWRIYIGYVRIVILLQQGP